MRSPGLRELQPKDTIGNSMAECRAFSLTPLGVKGKVLLAQAFPCDFGGSYDRMNA